MKLSSLQRSMRGKNALYRSPLKSPDGSSHYELVVEGPAAALEKSLGNVDLNIEVEPRATMEDMNKRVAALLKPFHAESIRRAMDPNLLSRPAQKVAKSEPARAVTVSIRPTSEHGTAFYFDTLVAIPLSTAFLFQVVFPPCSAGGAACFPAAGNPNVRLRFNSPLPPNVAVSAFPGLAIDTVSFVLAPWTLVMPFYQFPVAAAPCAARVLCWGINVLPF
jgi:hypothetical protein